MKKEISLKAISLKAISLKAISIIIAVGIWAIVLQNAGIIPTSQRVIVTNEVDAYVRGNVDVDNMVDVDLHVLGRPVGSHRSYTIDNKEYQAIDVFKSNW